MKIDSFKESPQFRFCLEAIEIMLLPTNGGSTTVRTFQHHLNRDQNIYISYIQYRRLGERFLVHN